MKQVEATKERPFYSVGYQYTRNPWTTWGFREWWKVTGRGLKVRRTMSGTDDLTLAKKAADMLVTQTGIQFAWVHVTTDCYNHHEVYKTERKESHVTH